jgi:hypothetical protein
MIFLFAYSQPHPVIYNHTLCIYHSYTTIQFIITDSHHYHFSIYLITQCRMVSQSLSVGVLVRILTIFPYLSKKISEPLHNLFLSQMADKMFKKNLAIAYAEGYALFTQAYGRGYGTTECSIFSLSVQFLNRDFLVSEIVDRHDFFPSACSSIEHMLESACGPAEKGDKGWSVAWVKEMTEQLLRHPILTHRRYSPMFSDLKVT